MCKFYAKLKKKKHKSFVIFFAVCVRLKCLLHFLKFNFGWIVFFLFWTPFLVAFLLLSLSLRCQFVLLMQDSRYAVTSLLCHNSLFVPMVFLFEFYHLRCALAGICSLGAVSVFATQIIAPFHKVHDLLMVKSLLLSFRFYYLCIYCMEINWIYLFVRVVVCLCVRLHAEVQNENEKSKRFGLFCKWINDVTIC